MTDDTSTTSSISRSHRYKVAMTARARQRRMRRIGKGGGGGGGSTNGNGNSGGNGVNSDMNGGGVNGGVSANSINGNNGEYSTANESDCDTSTTSKASVNSLHSTNSSSNNYSTPGKSNSGGGTLKSKRYSSRKKPLPVIISSPESFDAAGGDDCGGEGVKSGPSVTKTSSSKADTKGSSKSSPVTKNGSPNTKKQVTPTTTLSKCDGSLVTVALTPDSEEKTPNPSPTQSTPQSTTTHYRSRNLSTSSSHRHWRNHTANNYSYSASKDYSGTKDHSGGKDHGSGSKDQFVTKDQHGSSTKDSYSASKDHYGISAVNLDRNFNSVVSSSSVGASGNSGGQASDGNDKRHVGYVASALDNSVDNGLNSAFEYNVNANNSNNIMTASSQYQQSRYDDTVDFDDTINITQESKSHQFYDSSSYNRGTSNVMDNIDTMNSSCSSQFNDGVTNGSYYTPSSQIDIHRTPTDIISNLSPSNSDGRADNKMADGDMNQHDRCYNPESSVIYTVSNMAAPMHETYVDSLPPNNRTSNKHHATDIPSPTNTTTSTDTSLMASTIEDQMTDLLPNLSGELSPDEVRDAANFTSIQFQCSNTSGEVEVVDNDGTSEEELDGTYRHIDNSFNSVYSADKSATSPGSNKFSYYTANSTTTADDVKTSGCSDATGKKFSYYNASEVFMNQVWSNNGEGSDKSLSLMQRGEIFHHKAAAGIVSLLTPEKMVSAGLMAPDEYNNNSDDDSPPDVIGDSPTGVIASPGAGLTFFPDDPSLSRGGAWKGVQPLTFGGSQITDINDYETTQEKEEHVRRELLTNRMVKPSQQLAELLSQIDRDKNISALSATTDMIHRPYATRRKNACGALKILSAKPENRLKICWTVGVLDAIASVLRDVSAQTIDTYSFEANVEARNRIVSVLLNLSVNKKNRMIIVNHSALLEAITKCIEMDEGESRQGCCTVLFYLAKTVETRPIIIKCPGLIGALSKVIDVPRVVPLDCGAGGRKKIYQNPFLKEFDTAAPANGAGMVNNVMHPSEDGYHSPAETISDTEDDSSSVSSESTVTSDESMSGSETQGSHTHDEDDQEYDDDEEEIFSESSCCTDDDEDHSSVSHSEDETDEEEEPEPEEVEKPATDIEEMPKMEICFKTPVKLDEEEPEDDVDYDADPNRFLHGARLSVFACLLCLVKNKENAFDIARVEILMQALIAVSKKNSSPSHPRAIAILAHLTRSPKNCHHLVFKYLRLLPMLQNATSSDDTEARKYALCAIQNLSMDKSCRAPIAHTSKMIASLTERCNSENKEEVLAAVASLQNLSDEPSNLIQFTLVKNCIGTIISIAQSDKARTIGTGKFETHLTSFMAKNTLATISYWFRKIATSGSQRMEGGPSSPGSASNIVVPLYDAVLQPAEWNQWK